MSSQRNRFASISLDLDNTWSYLKIHGDKEWENYPSHFSISTPLILKFLNELDMTITFFIVGKDAAIYENQPWLKQIVESGHELGNHSFHHEPWIQNATVDNILVELQAAHESIIRATGITPNGFRGPGFSYSHATLEAVKEMGYDFDASILPTIIGPLARLYYFCTTKAMSKEEREKRKTLFGSLQQAWNPNTPFIWHTKKGDLIEIPVTTMPLFRVPFHLSYVLWLSQFSEWGAILYFRFSLFLCKIFNVNPSILLHPLDFLGKDDLPELSFFPGMNLSGDYKRTVMKNLFQILKQSFTPITMSQHASYMQKTL